MAAFQEVKPMPLIDQIKYSGEAADRFVKAYYDTLSLQTADEEKIIAFYAPFPKDDTPNEALFTFKSIWYNGNEFKTPADFALVVAESLTPAKYDIEAFDAQPLNPDMNPARDIVRDPAKGAALSVLVTVNGTVRVGVESDMESQTMDFTEKFILVPKILVPGEKFKRTAKTEWLVANQVFRNV